MSSQLTKRSLDSGREKCRDPNKGDRQSLDTTDIQLDNAFLRVADLKQVWMYQASLRKANLGRANLSRAFLGEADLSRADLTQTNLWEANLSEADLRGANLEDAQSLKGTNLRGVKGLTKEQLEACIAKGAIIDEDSTTSSSQSPVSPPAPSQSNDGQAPPAASAPGSIPTPDTGDSNAPSSKLNPES